MDEDLAIIDVIEKTYLVMLVKEKTRTSFSEKLILTSK